MDGGLGHVEPLVGTACALFDLTHGGEVFVELAAVFAAELVVHALGIISDEIENAAASAEATTNGFFAVFLDAKERIENLLCVTLSRNLDAVF